MFIAKSAAFPWVRRSLPAVTAGLLALGTYEARADVSGSGEDKPGFVGRILGFGKKKEEAPPAPPPAPVAEEKPKSTTPGPKPKVTTLKPKSGGSSSSKSTASGSKKSSSSSSTAKKTTPAPAKKEVAEKKTPPAPAPVKDGEFDNDKGDDEANKPIEVTKKATEPLSPPEKEVDTRLPSSSGWQIVKIGGRDYITGESLHQFYRFSSYKVDGKHVWLRSNNLIMKGTIGSHELLINNIKFILSYPVQESGGRALFSRIDLCKLIDPVLRPTYITDSEPFDTVVVDAGHGGHDAGARGVYGHEKDFALKMAQVLRSELMRRGFKVVMTRNTDTFVTLSGRVAVANATPNSIFLSLHFNSGGSSAASGIETFALTPQGSSASLERGGGYNANGLTGNSHDSANIALATAVHAMVISKFKFVDRGIKRAQWSVLTGCKRPSILFEGGFVTNHNECRLIASDTYRQSVTSAIADAVVNYRTALKGAMTRRR